MRRGWGWCRAGAGGGCGAAGLCREVASPPPERPWPRHTPRPPRRGTGPIRGPLTVLLVAWPLLSFAGHGDAPVVFTQQLTIGTATVTETQFLIGAIGMPATI